MIVCSFSLHRRCKEKAPGFLPGLFCSNNWRCMRCFIPIRRLLADRCRMVCPVFPAAPSSLPFQFPLFQAVCTRLTNGLTRFRVVSAAPIYNCSKVPFDYSSIRPFLQHVPGKRFRLPSPKRASTPRPDPGFISLVIDRFLNFVFTHTPEQMSESRSIF